MKNEFDYLNDVKMDFSCYEKNDEMERMTMKNRKAAHPEKILIAACITVLTVTTAFASGFVNNVIKMVNTGYNHIYQYDSTLPQPLPEFLQGKLFDKDGNAISSIGKNGLDDIYDDNGEKITEDKFAKIFEEASGSLVMVGDNDGNKVVFTSIEEAENIATFDIKTPEYLPDGYQLDKIYAYKDEDGSISGDYVNVEYNNENGETIKIFERLLNEETAFDMGTDGTVDEISVNGRKAALTDNRNLFLETEDNVSVSIITHGNITRTELIKIAEGMN